MKAKILVICTGNSCRSQMAEAYLKRIDSEIIVKSAGTAPAKEVNPFAVRALKEDDIDISGHRTHDVCEYLSESWDYVITVCGGAKENCPVFHGHVQHRLHIGFENPAEATGTDEEIMQVFRSVRDDIKEQFTTFYNETNKEYGRTEIQH